VFPPAAKEYVLLILHRNWFKLRLLQILNLNKDLSNLKNNLVSLLFANISAEVILILHIMAVQIVFESFCYAVPVRRSLVCKRIKVLSQPVTIIISLEDKSIKF